MSTLPNTSTGNETSVEDVIAFLAKNGIDNPTIWAHFDELDKVELGSLIRKLEAIEAEVFDKSVHKCTKKSFEADKSGRKGKVFEDITQVLMAGVRCFHSIQNVTTATNQLDLLVQLAPTSSVVPAFREWGAHFIAECKFHDTYVTSTWIEKLQAILMTHGSRVGLLISRKGIAAAGRGRNVIHLMQMLAVQNYFVLCLDLDDVRRCATDGGILQLLVNRFTEARVGARARSF